MKRELKKAQLAEAIAQHLLATGFADSGVRALAKAAGTSDRMLLYYFETKDQLLQESLVTIVHALIAQLDTMVKGSDLSSEALLKQLTAATLAAEFRPVFRLWFEIVGLAVRGTEPYRGTAQQISSEWQGWMASKLLKSERHEVPELFAQLEGRLLMSLLDDSPNS